MRWSMWLRLVVLALVAGCAADDVSERAGTIREAAVTNLIPPSDICNVGLKPKECVAAPPARPQALDRFVVDGEFDPMEYANALELPYTDLERRATSKIFVQIVQNPALPDGVFFTGAKLFAYFHEIPFRLDDVNFTTDLTLQVYVDSERFIGKTFCFDRTDLRYDLNFLTREVRVWRPRGPRDSCAVVQQGWQEVAPPFPFAFVVKDCAPDPSTAKVARCSAELRIEVPFYDINILPSQGETLLRPGIGFGVLNKRLKGGAPEHIVPSPLTVPPHGALTDRSLLPSLIFGPPNESHSFPLRIMTWNVRRFEAGSLAGPFKAVTNQAIGKFLAKNDIVAIQEGWVEEDVEDILLAANDERAAAGLPKFVLHGPVDFDQSLYLAIEQTVGNAGFCAYHLLAPDFGQGKTDLCETSGTHGGLWVMSHLPLGQSGRIVFGDCKGEDCFRAKGAQWLRFMINPPSVSNIECHGELGFRPTAQGCEPLASGDHFIDIFNTHLQADNPSLCDHLEAIAFVESLIVSATVSPAAGAGYFILKQKLDEEFNCSMPDIDVRKKQLAQLNSFVSAQAASDRPAVIVGDFNIDGKKTTVSAEYFTLVQELQLGPTGGGQSDLGTPWPDDYDWDIDHSDILRELIPQNVDLASGVPSGTFIGEDLGQQVQAPFAGDWDGNERFDYVLLRPPQPPNSPSYEKVRWVAMQDGSADPWSSPWPGIPGNFGEAPKRLSDHKPVVAAFRFAPIAVPGRFHPTWKHHVEQRVASADATGEGDCWTCGEVDLFTKMRWEDAEGGPIANFSGQGSTCGDNEHVSYPYNGCTANWFREGQHGGGTTPPVHHYFAADLWDADSGGTSGGDDLLQDDHGQGIVWDISTIALFRDSTRAVLQLWPIFDNSPIPHCTSDKPRMCFLTTPSELAPGQQF